MRRFVALAVVGAALLVPAQAQAAGAGVEVRVEGDSARLPNGCRNVDVARVGRDIFGFVVYRFHQVKRWCWNSPQITYRYVSTYVSDVDPNMDYKGVLASTGNYYHWCCGSSRSGHVSYRQGRFDNCVLWFPCTRREYPWVRIRAHGNGSYTYSTGI